MNLLLLFFCFFTRRKYHDSKRFLKKHDQHYTPWIVYVWSQEMFMNKLLHAVVSVFSCVSVQVFCLSSFCQIVFVFFFLENIILENRNIRQESCFQNCNTPFIGVSFDMYKCLQKTRSYLGFFFFVFVFVFVWCSRSRVPFFTRFYCSACHRLASSWRSRNAWVVSSLLVFNAQQTGTIISRWYARATMEEDRGVNSGMETRNSIQMTVRLHPHTFPLSTPQHMRIQPDRHLHGISSFSFGVDLWSHPACLGR